MLKVPKLTRLPRNGPAARHRRRPHLISAMKASAADTASVLPAGSLPKSGDEDRLLVKTILDSLEDSKAEELLTIDIRGRSSLGDHMVIASGRSDRHVGAIADHLMKALSDGGFPSPKVEGLPNCDWVLLDAGDVIVHIFRPEVRAFYNLEKMWTGEPEAPKPVPTRTVRRTLAS
jgi:ribosome-associated protein